MSSGLFTQRSLVGQRRVLTPAMELVNDWVQREPEAKEEVESLLASAELTMDDVTARLCP